MFVLTKIRLSAVSIGALCSLILPLVAGAWTVLETRADSSYTRPLMVMADDPANIMIVGGGRLGGTENSVQVTTVSIEPNVPTLGQCNAVLGGNGTGYGRHRWVRSEARLISDIATACP